MYSPPFQVGQYPFSPGSLSLKTTSSLTRLDAVVFKSAKAAGQVHPQRVAKSMEPAIPFVPEANTARLSGG